MSAAAKGALLLSLEIPPEGQEGRNPYDDRRIVSNLLANGDFVKAMGITILYTRDVKTAAEHLVWFKIARAEYLLRGGYFEEADSCVHEALARKDLLNDAQVAQALRLKANALKSQGKGPDVTNSFMMAASNLDGKESYWNWLGRADGVEIYAWIREDASEEVRKDVMERFKAQAQVNGKKVWKTYTVY